MLLQKDLNLKSKLIFVSLFTFLLTSFSINSQAGFPTLSTNLDEQLAPTVSLTEQTVPSDKQEVPSGSVNEENPLAPPDPTDDGGSGGGEPDEQEIMINTARLHFIHEIESRLGGTVSPNEITVVRVELIKDIYHIEFSYDPLGPVSATGYYQSESYYYNQPNESPYSLEDHVEIVSSNAGAKLVKTFIADYDQTGRLLQAHEDYSIYSSANVLSYFRRDNWIYRPGLYAIAEANFHEFVLQDGGKYYTLDRKTRFDTSGKVSSDFKIYRYYDPTGKLLKIRVDVVLPKFNKRFVRELLPESARFRSGTIPQESSLRANITAIF